MDIGQKINKLFEKSGYKNYADWGRAMNLPGDWLLDMKKKDSIEIGNVKRLIILAEYNHITLEELLKNDRLVDINDNLPDNDIRKMLDRVQSQLLPQENESKFDNIIMSDQSKEIAFDTIDILKGLIKSNL